MFRLRVQTTRSLLWLGNLLVILAIGMLLANIAVNRKKFTQAWMDGNEIKKYAKATGTIEIGGQSRLLDWKAYDKLWLLNVTGKEDVKPEDVRTPDAPDPVLTMKPLTDVIRITHVCGPIAGVVYLEDETGLGGAPVGSVGSSSIGAMRGGGSAGFQQDLTKRHETQVAANTTVRVDDTLRAPYDSAPYNSKLIAFGDDGLHFEWGGEEVVINVPKMAPAPESVRTMPTIDEESGEVRPGRSAASGVAEVPKAVRESRQSGEHGWFIGTDERDEIAETYEVISKEIEVTNHLDSDRKLRLRLDRIPVTSLAYRRGFREGDILRKINGEEILSKASFVQYFKRNPTTSTYQVELERDGQLVTKVFKVAR